MQESGCSIELKSREVNAEQQFLEREAMELLQREMRRIPSSLRTVLLLRHVDELNLQDIARRLDLSMAAAKSRLQRARGELRNRMFQCYGMDPTTRRTLPRRVTDRAA